MVSTLVTRLGVAAPVGAAGPRLIPKTTDGIPSHSLQNLFRFTETDATLGLTDAVTGEKYLTTGAGGVTMQSGGGMLLSGLKYLVGPTVNLDNPFTIAVGLTCTTPIAALPLRELVEVGTVFTNGFMVWYQAFAGDPTDAFGAWARASYDGTFGPAFARNPTPYTMKYGFHGSLIIRSTGRGSAGGDNANILIQQRRAGLKCQQVQTWDMLRVQGASGSRVPDLPVNFGAKNAAIIGESATYDVAAIYDRALDTSEIIAFETAAKAIALARGRA